MTKILANCVIRALSPRAPFDGAARVILVDVQADSIWLVQLERSDKLPIRYYTRPRAYMLRVVEMLVRQGHIGISEATPLSTTWLMSDAEIQKRYERVAAKGSECSQLSTRDRRWEIISPIVNSISIFELLARGRYYEAIAHRSKELGVAVKTVASVLHLYWAGGSSLNSLLPRYHNSGAPGEIRAQRRKLGAPNIASRNSLPGLQGFVIGEEDRQKLRFAWDAFVRPGRTVGSAYLRAMETFYKAGTTTKDGVAVAVLRPAHDRPTKRQFRYWGAGGNTLRSAAILQLKRGDFEKKHRALTGTARDGVGAVGQLAYCDATANDVHLVSAVSRLRAVGTAHRILVVDAYTGMWAGLYCGFEPPSATTALMAVANAALDKVDFCARFGIHITPDMWPAIAFGRYLCDNGEYRAEQAIQPITAFGATLEFAAVGRADLKGPVETGHKGIQARLDHKVDGTTEGRARERGEDHPALSAVLTYYEYMRLLIKRILHYNNHERCEHLLTTEMRRDNVQPTRTAIYKWCVDNGYVVGSPASPDIVRAHLLPSMPAVLTGSGVFLCRPDRGKRMEHVDGARFVGEVLMKQGLMHKARAKHEQIEVRGDPQDLRRIWLVRDGFHELKNVSADPLAITEWTLADHLEVQDSDALARHMARDEKDQRESDLDTAMFADIDAAKRQKTEEKGRTGKRIAKKSLVSAIRQNRETEKERMFRASLLREGGIEDDAPVVEQSRGGSQESDDVSPALALLRRTRGKGHQQ